MRDRRFRFDRLGVLTLVAFAGLGGAHPARAAGSTATTPPPRFTGERTDVVAVEVPVQVIRDGEPVRGLTRDDFSIFEGKQKQEITGFEVVDLNVPAAARGAEGLASVPLSAAARRHFLLLFDLSHSEPRAIAKARGAASELLQKLLPSDLVAVATHSATTGTRLVVGFTTDRRQAGIAIDTLGRSDLLKGSPDPLNLWISSEGSPSAGAPAVNRRGDDEFVQGLGEDAARNAASERLFQTQTFSGYTRALADLAKLMSHVAGRKFVVLLSEGFNSSLLVGTADVEKLAAISASVEHGEIWNVNNDVRFGSTRTAKDLEVMLEEFRRADCVIQSVDIGGLRGEGASRSNTEDGLFAMAQQTGGELFSHFNDLSAAMGKMLERTAVTYVLSFQPEVPRDGAFHKLKVELKDAPRGTRIASRAGYYAPKPFDRIDPAARLLDAADSVMGGREGGTIETEILAAPFPGGGGKSYVPVLIEVDGPALLAGTDGAALPAEIYAYALAEDGTIGDFFGQTLNLEMAKVKVPFAKGGLKYLAHLELTPGLYSLRILVRNGRTGASALRVVSVEVPALDPQAPTLSQPYFPESGAHWTVVREQPRGDLKKLSYPFVARQKAYLPAFSPAFAAGESAPLTLYAWNLPPGQVALGARVIGADGKETPGGELEWVEREKAATGTGEVLLARFLPTGLSPGDYRLLVHVTTTDTAHPLDSASVPFEVK